ncbi:Vacuolar protein sorting-associated protein 45 [Aphelenchoides bicaudatus]|nr:Vacuolar protein sorting-associated protein 45 [Aphelenchoides bicaudatus]
MDSLLATQQYINEMIRLASPGMKVILLDKETTGIISCAYAQSEMMQKEVYLFERIDSGATREPIHFLKCVVFVRPTPENVQLLIEELRSPRYVQYYIYFSNIISKADIKLLAEADEHETVREVQEFYADLIPIAPHLCSLGDPNCYETAFNVSPRVFRRALQGLGSLFLALRKRPMIKFQKSSRDSQRLAEELSKLIVREESLFEGCTESVTVIIMERSEDPVSPLLNQWTYEAMVHELIGITNNRVLMQVDGDEMPKNLVLSSQHDEFYAKNKYLNFGDIGQNIKTLMNEYQKKAQTHQQLESIADMKRFVEQYPQFRKISGTITKHVQIVGELSRLVAAENLLEISELEQSIVSGGDHSQCLDSLKKLLSHSKTSDLNALRLVMLYALRFESVSNSLDQLLDKLKQRGISARQVAVVRTLVSYAGAKRRQNDLFGDQSAMEMTKRFIKGLKGVENVFTQHEPHICRIVELLTRDRLSEQLYPTVERTRQSGRCENVIIFMLGGCTYEESAAVNAMNQKRLTMAHPRVLLCSNFIHNTKSFVDQLMGLTGGYATGKSNDML